MKLKWLILSKPSNLAWYIICLDNPTLGTQFSTQKYYTKKVIEGGRGYSENINLGIKLVVVHMCPSAGLSVTGWVEKGSRRARMTNSLHLV